MATALPQANPREDETTPLVIAHRGAWGAAGQNTLAAFEAAIALGADAIEFDVRRTRDGRLVIHHDPRAGGVATSRLDYADLRRRVAGSGPPLLDEVLELTRGRIALDVELKEPGYVADVLSRLRRFGVESCLVTSFLDDVVLEAKRHAPELETGLLVAFGSRASIVRRVRASYADYVGLARRLANAPTLVRMAAEGIPCLVWTVNDVAGLDRLLAAPGVAAVITDRPGIALERRKRVKVLQFSPL
jgi:glycerophosphoryl diester phosphodiesterase